MDINLTLTIFSLISAVLASIISYLAYKNTLNKDNENSIFEYKFKVYQSLIVKIIDYYLNLTQFIVIWDSNQNSNEIDSKADQVDNSAKNISNDIIKFSIFLPKNIIVALTDFSDIIHNTEILNKSKDFIDYHTQIEYEILKICELVRKDIGIDFLDTKLMKRIMN